MFYDKCGAIVQGNTVICTNGCILYVVLGEMEIPYTTYRGIVVFSANRFKGIDFQINQLCWHRHIVL